MNQTQNSSFPHAIVLTGGISTGKSTVAQMFADDGFEIIDADRVAHEVLERQKEAIAQAFGREMIQEGRVDRKALGALIFADRQKRRELEAILHPLIREEIYMRAQKLERKGEPYIVDIPLFFETHGYPIDTVIVVYAPREIQLKRLMQRDGYNMQEALARIEAQMPIDEKRAKATYVIDNSATMEALSRAYEKTKEQILKGSA